jgi:hypothetical protein
MKTRVLIVALCLAGCASDEDVAAETDQDGVIEEAMTTDEGDDSEYGDDPEPDLHQDPEQALAAIPEAMRPAELLEQLKSHLIVPDLSRGGRAFFTDIVTVEPGADVTFCTYLDYVTEDVLYLHDTLGSQTRHGHHAIMQYLTTPQEPGTRACPDDADLDAQLGQILGGTGGEGNSAIVLPANVVSEVPAGAQLVINHHWINTGDEAIEAQAEMITVPPESEDDMVIARAMAVVMTEFEIAAGETGKASVECTFESDAQLLSMIGHQHQWGTHVRAERMGDSPEMIFDHDYTPEMVSQPITTDFSVDAPFEFATGDTVRMTCDWHNTSDTMITFPREMCVLFGWQIGAEKDTTCINGAWL